MDAMGRVAAHISPPETVFPASASLPSEVAVPVVKMRILLADDNTTNRKVGLGQLHMLGYAAQAVTNGMEALRALEQGSYDVYPDGLSNAGTGRLRSFANDSQAGTSTG
jgi:hypothetical protein